MVTFRAVGIAAKRVDADTFDVTVEFTKQVDAEPVESLGRAVFRINTRPQLVERCNERLLELKAEYLETRLTLQIANQVLAEVTAT